MSSVWLLPVTSASQPHFFHVWRAISNHSHHINGSKITACEYFSTIFHSMKEIKQVCDAIFFFLPGATTLWGLVWRWGGPDGPVLSWKCQGLFLLASPAFTCIIHPSSDVSCPYFKRRKVLIEKMCTGVGRTCKSCYWRLESNITLHATVIIYYTQC